ncbi:hypothetical protein ACQPZP_41560 [Spirillospora sp. CA-142024]|uniref:hypothetical protein n=1 Tax=Spirillospora sp. CA-142024 TaxID=3240036 RepID=UPI003D8A93CB
MGVSNKSYSQLTAKVEQIAPGEQIVHALYAKVGTVPIKKNMGSIAASVAASAAVAAVTGGGMAMVAVFDKGRAYVAVTDRRVLVFGGDRNRPGPRDLLADLPREAVTAAPLRALITYKLRLEIAGSDQAIRLTFAPFPLGLQKSGRQLAELLPAPA